MSRLENESRPEADRLNTCSTNIKSCIKTVVGMSEQHYPFINSRRWSLYVRSH